MSEIAADALKVLTPAVIGLLGGYLLKRSEVNYHARKTASETWQAQKQAYWSPLLRDAQEFRRRLEYLRDIYSGQRREFDPGSLAGDFRELYMLSREPIGSLENCEPNQPRKDSDAVQRVRTRACHQLTFSESSLYITVRYLGSAERARRGLDEHVLVLPKAARVQIKTLLSNVRKSLQGSGAGLFEEQQEYMGETVVSTSGRVISNLEFRKMLFDVPGWEQFTNLLRFFVEFEPKLTFEIAATILALQPLEKELDQLCNSSDNEYKMLWDNGPKTKWSGWLKRLGSVLPVRPAHPGGLKR